MCEDVLSFVFGGSSPLVFFRTKISFVCLPTQKLPSKSSKQERAETRLFSSLCFKWHRKMEKHHKLRRPAGSSIHACNICGIEGHQAMNCVNGNVDWSRKWPKEMFQFEQFEYAKRREEPDYNQIAREAKAYAAKMRKKIDKREKRNRGEDVSESEEEEVEAKKLDEKMRAKQTKEEEEEGKNKNTTKKKDGWLVYYDNLGRPYYHNAKLGKTQWTPPDTNV